MSLRRLIFYYAVIGGWSAFGGWLFAEQVFASGDVSGGWVGVAATCATVGAAIGAGLNLVAGMANAQWKELLRRAAGGLVAGGVGGLIGGGLGNLLYTWLGLPRALGWMILGAAIGLGGGLSERSRREVRNGLIGGTIGGLVGGLLFDPLLSAIPAGTGMTSRATAFVILGLSIGALIGLVRVVLKEAWLTVLDGYRPGRQVILGDGTAILGRAEYATLPFLGPGDGKIEWEHVRISRRPDGRHVAEPKASPVIVKRNQQPITEPTPLADGDVLTLGGNSIRYNERGRRATERTSGPTLSASPKGTPTATRGSVPPPAPAPAPAPAMAPEPTPSGGIGGTPTVPVGRPSTSRPTPTEPKTTPKTTEPKTKPEPAAGNGAASAPSENRCPRCGRAAAVGQRYCIVCDESF